MEKPDSTFHTFLAKFLFCFRDFFFLRFSESLFSRNLLVTFWSLFAKLKAQTCWILRKSNIPVSHICDLRHKLFYLCFSQFFFVFFYESFSSQRLMVKKRLSNALLKASDAKIMLGRLLFHAFCIVCVNFFHLSFVIRCSVLVAVSLLVSQERLFVMQASDCFSGHFRRIRHSLFPASSTLYFHLEFVIWNFIAWKVFQKLL